jgi:pimeloyl-ACP methyl ester carboxylesterase
MKVRVFSSSLLLTAGLLTAALPVLSQPMASQGTQAIAPIQGATEKLHSFSVTRVGHGRPMILIPGLVSSGDVWTSTVEHFKDRYECHVLTLAGFAGQPAIPAPYLQTVRDDVLKYIADKKLDHPVIVGHSLGGFLAWSIASTAPDKVGPIIAVDGVPYLGALMNPAATPEASRPMADQMRQMYAKLTKEQLGAQSRMSLGSMITNPKNVETAAAWSAASDPATAGEAMAEMLTTDLRETVAAVRTPALLIGAADSAKDEASRRQLTAAYEAQVAKVPHHEVVMAEHARHFVMLDDPAFLFSTMDKFLSGETGAKRP